MTLKIKYALLILPLLIQLGCASQSETVLFEKTDTLINNQATVYLYRSDLHSLKGAYPFVFLDGEPLGPLEHDTYMRWSLKPGQYEWVLKAGDAWDELTAADSWDIREKKITLDVVPAQYYFLRLKPSVRENVMGWRDAKLQLVNEAKATKEMKGNRLLMADNESPVSE